MAKAVKIPWDQFRWYAAFHDEGHHPHIHMVCYSADGKSGLLNKQGISDIKSMLAKDPRVAAAYDLWYEQREEVLRTYKDALPERIPLSRQKEFKRIRNIVVEEAARLGELAPPDIAARTEPDAEAAPKETAAESAVGRLRPGPAGRSPLPAWT